MEISNYPYHPLPDCYLNILENKNTLVLTIMGKDPYPSEPMGIPFCKSTWDSMCNSNASGLNILLSLGADIAAIKQIYATPKDYFCELAINHGIAFLNLSYYFLGKSNCSKRKHQNELKSAEKTNGVILEKSERIIFCGEAEKHRWYGKSHNNGYEIVHPDNRCKNSQYPNIRKNWEEWWSQNAISEKFDLKI